VALSGVAARTGGLNLPLLILLGAAGMVLGGVFDYLLGRAGMERVIRRSRLGPRLAPQFDHAGELLARHGWWIIALSHVVGHGRSIMALTAGAGRLPLRRYLAYEVPAALLWSAIYAGGGYALAREWHRAEALLHRLGWVGVGALVLGALAWWVAQRQGWLPTRRRASPAESLRSPTQAEVPPARADALPGLVVAHSPELSPSAANGTTRKGLPHGDPAPAPPLPRPTSRLPAGDTADM
jgi:membrane protein DedA with SNARE-associated domain